MDDQFFIVERVAKSGSNIPVGLAENGSPIYVGYWKNAEKFETRESAERFLEQVKRAGLPQYADMTDRYIVASHGVIGNAAD